MQKIEKWSPVHDRHKGNSFLTQDDKIQIIEITKDSSETVIPLKKFYRKYEAFKQANINQAEEVEGTLEDDLRKVFVEAMCLSSELESQLKLLESKGISY